MFFGIQFHEGSKEKTYEGHKTYFFSILNVHMNLTLSILTEIQVN